MRFIASHPAEDISFVELRLCLISREVPLLWLVALSRLFSNKRASVFRQPQGSRERQVQIADRLVDLPRVLETNRGAVNSGILESELHGFHAVLMTILELTAPT